MKNMSKLLVVTLIISMLIPIVSYAISETTDEKDKEFFVSDKTQACQGGEIALSIDLNLIKFDNFEFILTSNMNLDGITTQDEIETDKDKNQLRIILNKKEMSLDKISLFYKIPEDIEIGSKINLTGLVKEYKDEEVDNNEVQGDNTVQEEQKVTITITVIEKQNEEENKENNKQEDSKQEENSDKENQVVENTKQDQNNTEVQNKSTTSTNKTQISGQGENQNTIQMQKTTTTNSMQTQETNTYNRESNNYLSKLSINGYDLTPEFSKTTNTYFVKVKENVNKITVNAIAEDENATVNVYGNTDLKEGENKVLISVTAENGEVKVYRVYVIK